MPGLSGTDYLVQAREIVPTAKRVLLTAYADTEAAIQAINEVDLDYYLLKPWDPPEEKLFPVLEDLLGAWEAGGRPSDSSGALMDQKTRDDHIARVQRDGFTIVENAISPELVDALNAGLERLELETGAKPAMNGFEGHKTVRIYNLLAFGDPFTRVPVHDNVLPVIDSLAGLIQKVNV